MAFALKGVAYITGAGSGIGQYTAYALARQGVRSFALLDRNPISQTVSELKRISPDISVKEFELDVTNEKAIDDSIEKTVKEFGRLDYAVNNAGIGGMIKTTDQIPKDDFEKVMAVNTTAVWTCQRAQIRQMLKQEKLTNSYRSYRGSIVNVASMYGLVAPPDNVPVTAYATSKHAVIGLTKSDALAFAHRGIKINAIAPGYVLTPLVQQTMGQGDMMEVERKKVPVHRYSEMEEIGDCIAFLHSDAASYMVGATLVADGGYTIV
ncbi:oxidoreductase ucpA [Cucurbitaria berberidis CBS 394.84]|uniref:Oxidoreductase ucpA n=1 Tax=Cucurbitaria berberidis CBS 394.84 TaxID=1168544 RepID=A0A9P4GJ71_9PLEO|nr:oxidoreductase ucpA [Cucurbitaria berberidis CBS 394.84]KAF1846267.1 oxidoreductase ucpA [Cucurbitaria berberidis CBS 394.84]